MFIVLTFTSNEIKVQIFVYSLQGIHLWYLNVHVNNVTDYLERLR